MNAQSLGLLYGSRAIAEYLDQASHVTVCGWIEREGLPVTLMGNAYCTTKTAVDRWFYARLRRSRTASRKRSRAKPGTKPAPHSKQSS